MVWDLDPQGASSFYFRIKPKGFVGMSAALYSPAQYGILTECLPPNRLVWANGWMEGFTVAAIILGAIFGGLLIGHRVEVIALVIGGFILYKQASQPVEKVEWLRASNGFALVSLNIFKNCSGNDRYQATWFKKDKKQLDVLRILLSRFSTMKPVPGIGFIEIRIPQT